MATSKSSQGSLNSSMTNNNNNTNQSSRNKEDLPALKLKVAELERQIIDYKTKLDELRRAKATTVVKLEKEYVNTTVPGLNRSEKSKTCEKCEELEKVLEHERKSNIQLKKLIEQKETNNKQTTINSSGTCEKCKSFKELLDNERKTNQLLNEQIINEKKRFEQERNSKQLLEATLEITQTDLIETKNTVEALKIENQEYRNAFERMKQEHEQKMAELFQREEEAKKQVATWEQMYREWMATMERRVNNLQMTNEELQGWLNEDNEMNPNRRSDNPSRKPRS